MVHEHNTLNPTHGYAVDAFKAPDQNRNHFHGKKEHRKIICIVLHCTYVNVIEPWKYLHRTTLLDKLVLAM